MKLPLKQKINKKKIIILTILAVVAIVGFYLLSPKKQSFLEFTTVKKQDIKSVVSSSGNLTGKTAANLKFKSSSKLSYINVKAGDQVDKGVVIAGLDTQDLSIALQQAQNTLRDKQATVDKIHDEVKGHDGDETFTQRQTRTTAETAANNAFDDVKQAQRAFQDTVIVSPISGIVTQASPVAGQVVSSSDVIAQIVDFSQIFFDTEIDEADIGKISLDQKTQVSLDAYPDQVFEGSVSEIIPQTKTTSAGATIVTVRINLGNPAITHVVNGLSGQASINIAEALNTLTVPIEALTEDDKVFVQTSQGLESKKVITGIKSDTDAEIKQGLSENEKVLLNPPADTAKLRQTRSPLGGILQIFRGSRSR